LGVWFKSSYEVERIFWNILKRYYPHQIEEIQSISEHKYHWYRQRALLHCG